MKRFWEKVEKTKDCWNWIANKFRTGYGSFWLEGKTCSAHRVSWILENGPIPNGLWVLHKCDNKACVRPDHLYLGTHKDNTRDAVVREKMARGENNPNTKLTEKDVWLIRLCCRSFTLKQLAKKFSVSRDLIWKITKKRAWRHV